MARKKKVEEAAPKTFPQLVEELASAHGMTSYVLVAEHASGMVHAHRGMITSVMGMIEFFRAILHEDALEARSRAAMAAKYPALSKVADGDNTSFPQ